MTKQTKSIPLQEGYQPRVEAIKLKGYQPEVRAVLNPQTLKPPKGGTAIQSPKSPNGQK